MTKPRWSLSPKGGTTASKLWLGFGTLIGLMALLSVAIIVRVQSIQGLVAEMDYARNLSEVVRQLERNLFDYALSVRAYLQSGDSLLRNEAAPEADSVEMYSGEYQRLATTPEEREMGARFAFSWQELRTLSQVLLESGSVPVKSGDSRRFYNLLSGLERLLNQEMQVEAIENYGIRRSVAEQEMRSVVGFASILLIAGIVIAVATSWAVGRGIVQAERELREARDELEDRVRERTAEVAVANGELMRSNRELEQFAAVASHDLQEPLRKIQAFGDRLQAKCGETLGEQGHEYLGRMLTSATRMRKLIDELLTFSRVTIKAQPFVPTSLSAVAKEVISDLESRIQFSGGRVDLGDLPTVDADSLQMRQLLQNLIANGLKFQRPGVPPVVTVRGRVLSGAAAGHDGDGHAEPLCEIAVEDNGIGFEEIYLDRIFEVFQRLHGRNEYEGTGMGLAICRKIVERHGGQITATSTPGQGATFLVTLPVQRPQEGNT